MSLESPQAHQPGIKPRLQRIIMAIVEASPVVTLMPRAI